MGLGQDKQYTGEQKGEVMGKRQKIISYCKTYGAWGAIRRIYARYRIKYRLGRRYYPILLEKGEREEQEAYRPPHEILLSLAVPLYNTPEEYLRQMIESVRGQTYAGWELCLVDASDRDGLREAVMRYGGGDERIRYRRLEANRGIAENTNAALAMAQGNYIGLMDHDDILHPAALYRVVREIVQYGADFIYTDELTFEGTTEYVQSIHLKPDFRPEGLRYTNYICHFTVFSKGLLERVGKFRPEFDGAQDYDLFLRMTECAEEIRHIPQVLYYWRLHEASTSSGVAAKPYIVESGRRALAEQLDRQGLSGDVRASEEHGPFYRVWYHVPEGASVFLLTESGEAAEEMRLSLRDCPLAVTVGCDMDHVRRALQEKKTAGAADYVVLVRDGYVPQERGCGWLTELLSCLRPSSNAAAAPVVYDRRGSVCHAGYCYDMEWRELIRPLFYGAPQEDSGYMNRLKFRQNVSLLGGAVLAVRGEIFAGFLREEQDGKLSWTDPVFWFSLCLFLQRNGKDCVVTPFAPWRWKGRTPDRVMCRKDGKWEDFRRRWNRELQAGDPCLNPGMKQLGGSYFLF